MTTDKRFTHAILAAHVILLLLGLALLPAPAAAATIQVDIEFLAPLSGQNGFLAFDLVAGSAGDLNRVVIESFTSASTLGAASTTGDVTGSLPPGPLELRASVGFSNYTRAITFGGPVSFRLTFTEFFTAASTPDSFAFYVLDSNRLPFATSDPLGTDSLLAIELFGAQSSPTVFTSSFVRATVNTGETVIPEPSTAAVAAAALAACAILRRKHQRRH